MRHAFDQLSWDSQEKAFVATIAALAVEERHSDAGVQHGFETNL